MDKFSLYDFLSFFLPGVVLIYILLTFYGLSLPLTFADSDAITALFFLAVALVAGLILHRITFAMLGWYLYRKTVYRAVDVIVAYDEEAEEALRKVNEAVKNVKTAGSRFDEAYYQLEVFGSSDAPKAFQSMYFFLRNLFTLLIGVFVVQVGRAVAAYTELRMWYLALFCLLLLLIIGWTAAWYRRKMIVRIFHHYNLYLLKK